MNLAEKLSRYAANLTYDDLTPEAIHEAKRRVLDSLGCAMGARHAEPARIARELALSVSASPGAIVIGTNHKSAPDHAAFANGVLFRYLDFNDTYLSKEPAHPSDNIAAILAAAEVASVVSGAVVVVVLVLILAADADETPTSDTVNASRMPARRQRARDGVWVEWVIAVSLNVRRGRSLRSGPCPH